MDSGLCQALAPKHLFPMFSSKSFIFLHFILKSDQF